MLTDEKIKELAIKHFGGLSPEITLTGNSQRFARAIESAVLEELGKQEPVAITCNEVTNTGYIYIKALDRTVPHGTKLYAAPVVQPGMVVVPTALLVAAKEVLRISDRKHDAWDLLKELIAAAEKPK